MRYRFLEDIAIADVAFVAEGEDTPELFTSAALALTNTMVADLNTVEGKTEKRLFLSAANPEILLYLFLQELVFYKDAELLLFSRYDLGIWEEQGHWKLNAVLSGEELNQAKHETVADVKAVSLHKLKVEQTEGAWSASVILDI